MFTTAAAVHHVRRDAASALRSAAQAAELSREHGFRLMLAWATSYEGRALADSGDYDRGLELIGRGLASARATGSTLFLPFHLALLAEVHLRRGLPGEAASVVADALAESERQGERLCAAELLRLRGETTAAASDDRRGCARAENDLRTAIETARGQGANLLTLRSAVSLARLTRGTAAAVQALKHLHDARASVREGAQLPDVLEAEALLRSTPRDRPG